jgi:hypothetical protein
MRIRLIGGIAAMAIALGALAFPSAEPVRAGSTTCTGWTSALVPPTSIRVYRTALKRTQTVPFRSYVERVMASEWGSTSPAAALRIGAITVKQFGWYYTMHWRGGKDRAGHCYDVVDTSVDQIYRTTRTPTASQRAAVALTWSVSLRKGDRFFLTGYRPGTGSCLAHIDGWKLYQRDAVDCVRKYGDSAEKLGRRFISSLSWITPGIGDFTADRRGDLAVVTVAPDTGETSATVYTTDAAYKATRAAGTLAGVVLSTTPADQLMGRAAGDVNGDGRADLVQLVQADDGLALEVILSTAAGFTPATHWWSDAVDPTDVLAGTVRLVVTDFDGDGRADAGIVRAVPGDAPVTSLLVASSTGTTFSSVRRRWQAAVDLTAATFLAGDMNGDGRGDLVALTAAAAGGTALQVAAAAPNGNLAALATWGTELAPPDSIKALVADANRDGRDDLVIVRRNGEDGSKIAVYRGAASGTSFARLYFATMDTVSFAGSRFSATDLNADGRVDLVALVDRGKDADGNPLGTDVSRFTSTGTRFTWSPWFGSASMAWDSTFPY